MLLEGWVPDEKKDDLIAYLEKNNILYVVQKAVQEDKAPILLKNKKFAKKFEMLGDLYSLPKYTELDLTPFLHPFTCSFWVLPGRCGLRYPDGGCGFAPQKRKSGKK